MTNHNKGSSQISFCKKFLGIFFLKSAVDTDIHKKLKNKITTKFEAKDRICDGSNKQNVDITDINKSNSRKISNIIGFGNAIIDLLIKTDDDNLSKLGLIKATMKLVDDDFIKQIIKQHKIEKITAGGSVANSIKIIANLGLEAMFVGKFANDEFGFNFVKSLNSYQAKCFNCHNFKKDDNDNFTTASSAILISNDGERTMATNLGNAGIIDDFAAISYLDFNNSLIYLEGYLWHHPSTISNIKKIIAKAKQQNAILAFTISDLFCINNHRQDFLEIITNDADIIFANQQEIFALMSEKDIADNCNNEASFQKFDYQKVSDFWYNCNKSNNKNNKKIKILVVTLNNQGCALFYNSKYLIRDAYKVEKVIDSTGAGDAFAAGFIASLVKNNFDFYNLNNDENILIQSLDFANLIASKVIVNIGCNI